MISKADLVIEWDSSKEPRKGHTRHNALAGDMLLIAPGCTMSALAQGNGIASTTKATNMVTSNSEVDLRSGSCSQSHTFLKEFI